MTRRNLLALPLIAAAAPVLATETIRVAPVMTGTLQPVMPPTYQVVITGFEVFGMRGESGMQGVVRIGDTHYEVPVGPGCPIEAHLAEETFSRHDGLCINTDVLLRWAWENGIPSSEPPTFKGIGQPQAPSFVIRAEDP